VKCPRNKKEHRKSINSIIMGIKYKQLVSEQETFEGKRTSTQGLSDRRTLTSDDSISPERATQFVKSRVEA
jgi:hypothetical protein